MTRWLLPQGIEDVLPRRAEAIEGLRRRILDLSHRWGYALVQPPEVEFLDSLLTGVGSGLGPRTLKVVDQNSGYLMGFRADMTPQVARMDASRLPETELPRRLCYAGTTLRAQPDNLGGSRAPHQVGAEIFGVPGVYADAEIIALMAATLSEVGVREYVLDLGQVGLYSALTADLDLEAENSAALLAAMGRKDADTMSALLAEAGASDDHRRALALLPHLHGGPEVLEQARGECAINPAAKAAIDDLQRLVDLLRERGLEGILRLDLGELRGYDYHTGPVFAAFVAGEGRAVLQGGRYDGMGAAFGRSRPATGFSGDLKQLADLMALPEPEPEGVLAPLTGPDGLRQAIQSLRAQGVRVVEDLEGHAEAELPRQARALGCAQVLVRETEEGAQWQVQPVGAETD